MPYKASCCVGAANMQGQQLQPSHAFNPTHTDTLHITTTSSITTSSITNTPPHLLPLALPLNIPQCLLQGPLLLLVQLTLLFQLCNLQLQAAHSLHRVRQLFVYCRLHAYSVAHVQRTCACMCAIKSPPT